MFWAVSGKECKSDTDCAGIANTTCMRHPDDTKLRCLCGEKKSPHNGACHHSKQGKQKCHVLICRDILVESIYFYFYEKNSRFKHITYDQAGGATDFFWRILQWLYLWIYAPAFLKLQVSFYILRSLSFWTFPLLQKYKIEHFRKINLVPSCSKILGKILLSCLLSFLLLLLPLLFLLL